MILPVVYDFTGDAEQRYDIGGARLTRLETNDELVNDDFSYGLTH